MHDLVIPFFTSIDECRELSNFHIQGIEWADRYFHLGSEQAYVFTKVSLLLTDKGLRKRKALETVMRQTTPSACKTFGNSARDFKRNNNAQSPTITRYDRFHAVAENIMLSIIVAKFTQHDHLREALLRIGDRLLAEASKKPDPR